MKRTVNRARHTIIGVATGMATVVSASGMVLAFAVPSQALTDRIVDADPFAVGTTAVSDDTSADSMPENPDADLPDKVAGSFSDGATVVAEQYVMTNDGKLKNIETGKTVTDPELVGTKDTQPDPLAKTGGESFIPVEVGEVREKLEESQSMSDESARSAASYSGKVTVRNVALQNSDYGPFWGAYNGTQSFFDANGNMFVQNAHGVIDVSEHNGVIDWQAAKQAGVEGAIIRIGYGIGNVDAQAQRNISECKRLGIPFGIYLYSYAYDAGFAGEEADSIADMLANLKVNAGDLSYPIYYDLEAWTWPGHQHPTQPAAYDDIVNTWYQHMNARGYTNLGVYSYTSYLYGPLNSDYIHSKTSWVAQYGPVMGYSSWTMNNRGWQYTSGGSVAGIQGRVDLNAFGRVTASSTGKWVTKNGEKYWYENGKMATSKEIYDPDSDAWYWLDADGTMARNKDVYQRSNGGKWVRYDNNGHMIKGEDYRYGGWYYFDPVTGAMAKGMRHISSNGGKWVYYDWTTGKMRYGQVYVNYDKAHTGWYLFDKVTGAMFHGFTYLKDGDKWVYYDDVTGIMAKDYVKVNGAWYYFSPSTGKMAHGVTWVPGQEKWLYFDPITGRHAGAGEYVSWRSASGQSQPTLSKYPNLSLEVRLADQVVLVNSNGKTIYAMIASTGTGNTTAKGSYVTKGSGQSFYNNSSKQGGRFWIGLNKGGLRFQSVPTDSQGNYIESEARKLGSAAGNGNIRLTVADAQWLYDQLPQGTPVHIG